MSREVVTGVVISDLHAPDHHKPSWDAFLQWCDHNRPQEVILNGDIVELESMSSHVTGTTGTLESDLACADQVLSELMEANSSDCKYDWLEGNHETRGKRKAKTHLPEAGSLLDIGKLLHLEERGIVWHEEGAGVKRGDLLFVHGYYYCKHHAAKHLDAYKCDIAYGHTHRPQSFTTAGHDNVPLAAYGLPCMRTLRPEWKNGAPTGWVNGFGVYNYLPGTGQYNLYTVMIKDGKFMWNGRMYGE